MRQHFGFQRWLNIPARYRIVAITTLALFLLSGVLTSGLIAVHAFNQKPPLHMLQKVTPYDSTGTLLWRSSLGGTPDIPVFMNGTIYDSPGDGYLYALNSKSGKLLWKYQPSSGRGIGNSTLAAANGVIYYGDSASCYSCYLNALDAKTQTLLWQYQTSFGTQPQMSAPPTIVNGVVYATADGIVYTLNASKGTLLWQYPTSGNITTSPTIANGVLYVGSWDSYLYALNAYTGALIWRYQTAGAIEAASPVVAGGIVAIGSDKVVYALSTSTGKLLWQATVSNIVSTPVIVDGALVVCASNWLGSFIYAYNLSNGTLYWTFPAQGAFDGALSNLVEVNGVIYFNTGGSSEGSTGSLYALNAHGGISIWSYQDGSHTILTPTQPVVANGVIYVGSNDGNIYALTAPPPAGPQGTERLGGSNPSELGACTRCAGDPIDTFSGNFSHTWTDFAIPGRGIPLLLSRTYNAQGVTQQGPFGYGWTDSYNLALTTDSSGNVTIQQEGGSTVTFTPNAPNGYTAPPRVLATLVQNSDGSFTFTRANQLQYVFNSSGQLMQEVDRNGYVTHLTYNTSNQLTTVTDPTGRSLAFTYGSNGLIASVKDPLNHIVSFQYDTNNNLIVATDANGGVTHFTYDANHLMLTMTDPNGGVISNVYDSNARVVSQTDALNRKTTFSYGTSSTTITDPNGNVTVEQYQSGLLVSETKGSGTPQAATWSYTYDPLSLGVASTTDPDGHVWTQTWDASGNLLSSTDPLKRTATYTYDMFNDLNSMTDPLGVTTTYVYDAHGNLLTVSHPLKGTKQVQNVKYTYGDTTHPGDITLMTDPDGKKWHYAYDQYGNMTSMTDPLKDKATVKYNTIGWKTSQVSPNGNVKGGKPAMYTIAYVYDALGEVTQITDSLAHKTSYQYDANHNLIKTTDALGQITQYSYDADNELTNVTRANGSMLAYSYDSNGNQTVQKDWLGNATTYAYDSLNRPISMNDPLNRKTSYSYDLSGNMTTLTNPAGQVTTYGYDTANEVVSATYSDGHTPIVSFAYDADSQRISMIDGTGKTTYSYDSLHRLTQSTNGAGSAVSYSYDLKGNLLGLTYPGNLQVMRSYDAAGRMTSVKDWLGNTTSFAYDANSDLIGETYPNQVQATFSYDHDDQITSIVDKRGTSSLLNLTYTRNNLSLLASQQAGSSTSNYTYTPLNQVSAVNQQAYQYDKADNLTQNGTTALTYNVANELTCSKNNNQTTTFNYDTQGNRTKMTSPTNQVTTYTYDQANRLTAYGTTATYSYDGNGLRMSKTVSGTTEAFTWDIAEGLPLVLQDGTTRYVYGPGGAPLEQVSGSGTVLYYHQDQLGSTSVLTNTTGTAAATYTYDAYGKITTQTGTVTNPILYAGQYTDAESGLQYLRARYYDPSTGQFLSKDPAVAKTQSPYAYVYGDPVNAQDPSGLFGWSDTVNVVEVIDPLRISHYVSDYVLTDENVKKIAVVPYAAYYLSYRTLSTIGQLPVIGPALACSRDPLVKPLYILQASGLEADQAIDSFKRDAFHNKEPDADEGKPIYLNPDHRGIQVYGPGVQPNGRIDEYPQHQYPWSEGIDPNRDPGRQ